MRASFLPLPALLVALAGCTTATTPDGWNVGGDDGGASRNADTGAGQSSDTGSGGNNAPDGTTGDGGSGANDGSAESSLPGDDASSDSAPGPGPESGTESDSGLTQEQLAWLVPQNAARAAVGEAPLVWDPIAAQVAQNYASQCTFAHNPNRSTQYAALGGQTGLGEDIAAGAPTQSIADAVASWVNEQQYYDHATNTCAANQQCGHYTQIVWSTTTAVGCAKVSCTTGSPFGTFAMGMWDDSVCDYSPPGNVSGQSPY
jgi:pathogenesis-related protein 1